MRTAVTPDGLSLAIHEHGGTGRPTLLCHATGFHGAVWEPLSAALGEGFARWAVDFRAHGASEAPPDPVMPWEEIAGDVLTAVDALALPAGEILGVGHSMGGACLLLAELARPGTFAGLWLFEPIVFPGAGAGGAVAGPPPDNPLAEGALRRRRSFPSRAEAIANFSSKPPFGSLRADVLHAYVRHGFVDGEDGEVHLACRPEYESQVYRGGGAHGAYERLGEVACPVVVAHGGDGGFPALIAPELAERLPGARLEAHPHVGHFGPLEAPTYLAASIAAFAATL